MKKNKKMNNGTKKETILFVAYMKLNRLGVTNLYKSLAFSEITRETKDMVKIINTPYNLSILMDRNITFQKRGYYNYNKTESSLHRYTYP
jgi:hypothetical protein